VNGAKKTKVHGREMHFEVGRLGANLYNICICGDSRARLPCSIRSFGNSGVQNIFIRGDRLSQSSRLLENVQSGFFTKIGRDA